MPYLNHIVATPLKLTKVIVVVHCILNRQIIMFIPTVDFYNIIKILMFINVVLTVKQCLKAKLNLPIFRFEMIKATKSVYNKERQLARKGTKSVYKSRTF